jgi:hypothetical protein
MTHLAAFLAGFATGFVARGTVDSSRNLTVGLISATYEVLDRAKRFVAVEREHLEDLVAEGKAHYEAKRARVAHRAAAATSAAGQRVADAARPRRERAA